jgi:hypothetical protein
MGLWFDADNSVSFEYDPAKSSQWRAVHTSNGSETVQQTGVSFRSKVTDAFDDRHFLGLWFTEDRIVWYMREKQVAEIEGDFVDFDFWKYRPRHTLESTDGNGKVSWLLNWETLQIGQRTHSFGDS